MPLSDVVIGDTPLFFSAQVERCSRSRAERKRMEDKKTSEVSETSTTLLRDVADSQHARWVVFHSRYEPM